MKYRLRKYLGDSTVHRIGNYLRAHGTGKHWVEKYRGDIFIFVSDEHDEAILQNEFKDVLDAVGDTLTDKHRTTSRIAANAGRHIKHGIA